MPSPASPHGSAARRLPAALLPAAVFDSRLWGHHFPSARSTPVATPDAKFSWMLFLNLVDGSPPNACTWKADDQIAFCAPAIGVYDGELDKWGRPLRQRTSSYQRASQRRSVSLRESMQSQRESFAAEDAPPARPGWRQRFSERFSSSRC